MNKKTILITGATGGIGGAAVRYFLRRGWYVIAPVRSLKKSEAQGLMKLTDIQVFRCDVENKEEVDRLIISLKNDNVHIDRVFLAAGIFLWDDGFPGPLLPYDEVKAIVRAANLTTKETIINALSATYKESLGAIDFDIIGSHAADFREGHPFRTGETIYADTMLDVRIYGISLRDQQVYKSVTMHEPGLIDTLMARAAFIPDRAPDIDWSKAMTPEAYIESIFSNTAL